jgi:GNAT superfamily N-acetyltransferase
VCARHDETGELAGYSELIFTPRRRWLGEQGDTAVDPAHRERGLGRWLKAANILRLLDEKPDVRAVETWNDGSNAAMLSINEAMGFRQTSMWRDAELNLA